jgi:soluble lytic murein transglycosylase-like protein
MRMHGTAIGVGLLAGLGSAAAQTAAPASPPQTFATVDANGRVQPVAVAAKRLDVIDRPAGGAAPCPGASPLQTDAARALVARIAAEENFYPEFVLSVAKIESHFNSTTVSGKGAYGLMQLMPQTARRFKVDFCDPQANVRGGVRLLRVLHERYRNPFFILAAYNAGEDAVQKSRGVPPYPETVRFVADVMNDFYAWPNPARTNGSGTGTLAAAAPDIIGTTAVPPQTLPSQGATPAAPKQWSDGFVMHVD